MTDVLNSYPLFREKLQDLRQGTRDKYVRVMKAFIKFLSEKGVNAENVLTNVEQLKLYSQMYKNFLREKGVGESHINVVISALLFFGKAQHSTNIGLEFVKRPNIEIEKDEEGEEDYLTKEEFLKIWQKEKDEKYRLIYAFLLVTGMRPAMIENRFIDITTGITKAIAWNQFEEVNHEGHIFAAIFVRKQQNKGNHPYITFVTPEVWRALKRYRKKYESINGVPYGDDKPVFPLVTLSNLKNRWGELVDSIEELRERLPNGYRRCHLYTIRKLFSTIASQAKIPENFVDFFMGEMPQLRARYRRHYRISLDTCIPLYAQAINLLRIDGIDRVFEEE